jgi:hypothetical protein
MRSSFLVVLMALGCSPESGSPSEPNDAALRGDVLDATRAEEASLVDGAIDAVPDSPSAVSPTDSSDASGEPLSDVETRIDAAFTDATSNDRMQGDGPVEDGGADVSRDGDASADRCRNTALRATAWATMAAFQADASGEVDAAADNNGDGARGDGTSARDGSDDRLSDSRNGSDVLALCSDLQTDWRAFVTQNRGCTVSSDCTVVGGAGACDCAVPGLGRPIGDPSGDAIASSARMSAEPYLDQWTHWGCNFVAQCVADAAPAKNLRCDQGKCMTDPGVCNAPPPTPEPCR